MFRRAHCSLGMPGIVLRDKHWIRYPDGTYGYAYTGVHFPKIWRRWSSRNPRRGWGCSCTKHGAPECVGPCYDFCACKHCWNGWQGVPFRTRLNWRLHQIWWDFRRVEPSV